MFNESSLPCQSGKAFYVTLYLIQWRKKYEKVCIQEKNRYIDIGMYSRYRREHLFLAGLVMHTKG